MSKLTMEAGQGPVLELDLGDLSAYCEGGDLAGYGGNLYIHIDGKEVGSLFFHTDVIGRPMVTLGQFDPEDGEWVERNDITFIDFTEEVQA